MRVEGPAMVGALDVLPIKVPAVQGHAAVRTSVAQGEGLSLPVAPDNEWNLEQQGFTELVAMHAISGQSAIPEARKHERVGGLALRRVELGHGREITNS